MSISKKVPPLTYLCGGHSEQHDEHHCSDPARIMLMPLKIQGEFTNHLRYQDYRHVSCVNKYIYIYTYPGSPITILLGWFWNHHFLSTGLSSSKTNSMHLRSHLTPGRDQKDPSPTVRVWELLSLWGGGWGSLGKITDYTKNYVYISIYNIIIIIIYIYTHTHTLFSMWYERSIWDFCGRNWYP